MVTTPLKNGSGGVVILTTSDVSSVLSSLDPELALESQRNAFAALSTQFATSSHDIPTVQCPQRTTLKSETMTSLFMPSRVADAGGMACKIVSIPTNGGEGGLPATTVIMDEKTGRIKAIVNARRLTALRNACGT